MIDATQQRRYYTPDPNRSDCMRIVSEAQYWWLQAEAERQELRTYGDRLPLAPYLDRLQCLGTDAVGACVFAVELSRREYFELMGSLRPVYWTTEIPADGPDRAKAALFTDGCRPDRKFRGTCLGVLVFTTQAPITDTTKEPS